MLADLVKISSDIELIANILLVIGLTITFVCLIIVLRQDRRQ